MQGRSRCSLMNCRICRILAARYFRLSSASYGATVTSLASENSEVSPVALLVAMPVTNTPGDSSRGSLKVNGAVPLLLVVTVVWPIKV